MTDLSMFGIVNPDNIGSSEYRALHSLMVDVADSAAENEQPPSEAMIAALREVCSVAAAMLRTLADADDHAATVDEIAILARSLPEALTVPILQVVGDARGYLIGARWVCPNCGGERVQLTAWVDANTGARVSEGVDGPRDVFWCEECEAEISGIEERPA